MNKDKLQKGLYSIKEVSVYLRRNLCSVCELIWSGTLPYVKAGRRVHIDIYDFEKLIEENKY